MLYLSDIERLLTGWNVAQNGRLFCLMLFVLCGLAFGLGYGPAYARLAMIPVACVGASCIVDQMPAGGARTASTVAVYLLAIVGAVLFLFWIG